MLLGTLGTSLLRNLITGKGTIRAVAGFSMPLPFFNKLWNTNVLSKET